MLRMSLEKSPMSSSNRITVVMLINCGEEGWFLGVRDPPRGQAKGYWNKRSLVTIDLRNWGRSRITERATSAAAFVKEGERILPMPIMERLIIGADGEIEPAGSTRPIARTVMHSTLSPSTA